MTDKKYINVNNILFCIEILLFFVLSFFFVPCGDDLIFGYDDSLQFTNLSEFLHCVIYYGNGRFLGNAMCLAFSKIPLAFYLLNFVLIVLFSVIVEKLFELKNIKILVFSSFILMPLAMFRSTVAWMCSEINYFMPIFCLALTLLILKKKNAVKSKGKIVFYAFVLVALGVAEQLFVEHNTIINIIISFAIVVFWCKAKKKNKILPILLFISNIAGASILFLYSKYIDYSRTWVFLEANGYRSTILSSNGLKDAVFFAANNFRFIFVIYCTSILLYMFLIFALFYISKKSKETIKHRKILLLLCMLYYPVCMFCIICDFLDVYWLKECLIVAVPAALNITALLVMIYFSVIKCAPKTVTIKVCTSLFLAVVSFAPFLLVSPCGTRCCLFSYFFYLAAVIYVLKFAKERYGLSIEKAYKFITTIGCVVLAVYIGIYSREHKIYDYRIQYIGETQYLPETNEHFVFNGNRHWRYVNDTYESYEYIPLDEWKEIVGID